MKAPSSGTIPRACSVHMRCRSSGSSPCSLGARVILWTAEWNASLPSRATPSRAAVSAISMSRFDHSLTSVSGVSRMRVYWPSLP